MNRGRGDEPRQPQPRRSAPRPHADGVMTALVPQPPSAQSRKTIAAQQRKADNATRIQRSKPAPSRYAP